jgi:hypothetical protein
VHHTASHASHLRAVHESQPAHKARTIPAVPRSEAVWTLLQLVLLLAGVGAVGLLLFVPEIGIKLFWNVLIPIAPITVVLLPGLWRNICPMATLSLLPRDMGMTLGLQMPRMLAGVLALVSLAGLYIIVPLRHVLLNFNGPMTAAMLLSAAGAAVFMGVIFKGRSGWCATLCPIHPVEKMYGSSPLHTFSNAQCAACSRCSGPCPDSTLCVTPAITGPTKLERLAGTIMMGSFPGFVWGWFQVGDYVDHVGPWEIFVAYAWPYVCAGLSMAGYIWARGHYPSKEGRAMLIRICATAAVATYYWYRIPMLGGFGEHAGTGLLADLTGVLPAWTPMVSHAITTLFLAWFLLVRPGARASWLVRPEFVDARQPRQLPKPKAQPQTQVRAEAGETPVPRAA